MSTKDWITLAIAACGLANAIGNHIIYWQGRRDVYDGDRNRSGNALRFFTAAIQALLIAIACWVCCLIEGIS